MKIPLRLVMVLSAALVSCKGIENKQPVPGNAKSASASTPKQNAFSNPDQSPMDMSYLPSNYPLLKMKGADSIPVVARVIYSRPHKNGRKIFGDGSESLCKYGEPWRLGANEATEIEFFRPVIFNGKVVQPGRYVMYCIPQADKWTIILNTNLYAWGLHINPDHDVLKTDVPVIPLEPALEDFTLVFLPAQDGADMLMAWDNVKVLLPVKYHR